MIWNHSNINAFIFRHFDQNFIFCQSVSCVVSENFWNFSRRYFSRSRHSARRKHPSPISPFRKQSRLFIFSDFFSSSSSHFIPFYESYKCPENWYYKICNTNGLKSFVSENHTDAVREIFKKKDSDPPLILNHFHSQPAAGTRLINNLFSDHSVKVRTFFKCAHNDFEFNVINSLDSHFVPCWVVWIPVQPLVKFP